MKNELGSTEPLYPGDRVRIDAEIKDEDGNLTNPNTHSIVLKDPDGVQSGSAMTNPTQNGIGDFSQKIDIPSDAEAGIWTVEWTAGFTGAGQKTGKISLQIYA